MKHLITLFITVCSFVLFASSCKTDHQSQLSDDRRAINIVRGDTFMGYEHYTYEPHDKYRFNIKFFGKEEVRFWDTHDLKDGAKDGDYNLFTKRNGSIEGTAEWSTQWGLAIVKIRISKDKRTLNILKVNWITETDDIDSISARVQLLDLMGKTLKKKQSRPSIQPSRQPSPRPAIYPSEPVR